MHTTKCWIHSLVVMGEFTLESIALGCLFHFDALIWEHRRVVGVYDAQGRRIL